MLKSSARFVVVLAMLCAATTLQAWAAEGPEGAGARAPEPLPFLTAEHPDCAAVPEAATPPTPEFLSAGTGTTNVCTGCSSHNCFYQTVGTRCSINGEWGRCVENNYCPEIRELSCSCVP